MSRGFPTAGNRADRTARSSLSPLPHQATHSYGVTNAYHGEVKVCIGGHVSTPPSKAAAVALPAGSTSAGMGVIPRLPLHATL
jgi:hypothetical protein